MWKFIRAEWKYWLKSPMTWILFFVNTLIVFGAVYSDSITIGGGVGNVHKNSPHTIQTFYGAMSLIGLLITTAYMNATANRDFQYDMYQLVFSSPIKKRDYFFGKFIGAYTMAIIPILGVSAGSLIAPLMPGLQPERYGPALLNGHVLGLLGFAIPNIFISGVFLFTLAIIFRSNIVSFIGAMVMLIFYIVSSNFTSDIQKEWLANLLDPFGFRPANLMAKYATVSEKNLHATSLSGPFLTNRIIWICISAVVLLVMYKRFSFSTRNTKEKKKQEHKTDAKYVPGIPLFNATSANKLSLKLFLNLMVFEIKSIIRNPTFIIIGAMGGIDLIASLTAFTGNFGAAQYPVTYHVVDTIKN
jgi:ABC-2 type transport system permease protein